MLVSLTESIVENGLPVLSICLMAALALPLHSGRRHGELIHPAFFWLFGCGVHYRDRVYALMLSGCLDVLTSLIQLLTTKNVMT